MIPKTVRSERGQTHYWINDPLEEPAPCVVFCHGLTADHTLFEMQLPFWVERASVVTWDWPLHGLSRPYADFTFDHVADELHAILGAEGIERAVLVGQSAGGYIAQAHAQRYPDEVAGIVGIGTTPFGVSEYYESSDLFWIRHYATIARMLPYGYYCSAGAKAVARTEPARQSMRASLERLGKKGMLEAAKAVYDEFLAREEAVEPACPVLLTHGEHDQTGLVPSYNQMWAQRSGHELVLIPDAAHNANFDNPDFFNALLADFIAEHCAGHP